MKAELTDHLKLRLKVRKIPANYPETIFKNPEKKYHDIAERTTIAIKKLRYNNKIRNIMIAYEERDGKAKIITIHPISEEKIVNRIIRGRWVSYE